MNLIRPMLGVAAVFVIALTVGCASHGGESTESTRSMESLSSMRAAVANTQAQVDRVLSSLNSMSTGNDLANSYKSFDAEVGALRQSAEEASQRATLMKDKEKAYVAMWQKDMESDTTPAVRATLEQRKAAVPTNFESARIAGQGVRQAFGPFNQHLRDLQKALSNNLTPQTVAQYRPTIDQARAEGRELKNRLVNFAAALDRMQAGLASTGAPGR